MASDDHTIIYTLTDEAPALATRSLLPVVTAIASLAGVSVEPRDISLAGRILAAFADRLPGVDTPDALAELGALATLPHANIIKLPNISASQPQLDEAIEELRSQGVDLPPYPAAPISPDEVDIAARYDRVKGSAVNPVLREGNSDRRAPASVKSYARSHPHSMGVWSPDCRTRVATMTAGDFRSTEKSVTVVAGSLRIVHVAADGTATPLRDPVIVTDGEIVDAAVMRVDPLRQFLRDQWQAAHDDGLLFSLHLKATMMKVSDPIIFGHALTVALGRTVESHRAVLERAGADPANGLASMLDALSELDNAETAAVRADIDAALAEGPAVAMVNSDEGITNFHVPSDVIVDASMPAMIRSSGQMWNADGNQQDTLAVLPDSSYAGIYQVVLDSCRRDGAFDPTTMGSVPNVGLMAQKAEEYGSHDTTFEIATAGAVKVIDDSGATLLTHDVAAGDIWRMCTVKAAPIDDWVRLALERARATGAPAIFWLDRDRPHDAELLGRVDSVLAAADTNGLDIRIAAPVDAMALTLERVRAGLDTISVTGNVLRDYLTDLFPILELGTSAKMLSIVPLMAGGGLFETGAGGSAPKHVEQFVAENHLRWDSLGEFLALAASFEHLADRTGDTAARVLAATLDRATATLLESGHSPSRKVHELDNRGSHYYLARYWAEELAAQTTAPDLATAFAPVASELAESEPAILAELAAVQGSPVDLGGYYRPDEARATAAMRPSETFNRVIDTLAGSA